MATTPHPEPRPTTDEPPSPPSQPAEEVWETVRPIHPASRFQAVRLAAVPPLARNLTIPPRPHRVAKETRR